MESLSYRCVALDSVNRGNDIKRDGEYYYVCLGALNIFNSQGHFYEYEASKAAFDNSTVFMRTMLAGNQYGEDNHPKYEGWMTDEQFLIRNEQIDVDHRAVMIREIDFIPNGKMCNGLPVMEIWGWVKPFGVRGGELKKALDDPHQNVCFSIRAWINEKWVSGVKWMMIDETITFDWVPEPGIAIASKFYAEHGHKITNEKLPRHLVFESYAISITDRLLAKVAAENEHGSNHGRKLACESYLSRKVKDLRKTSPGIDVAKGGLVDKGWKHGARH